MDLKKRIEEYRIDRKNLFSYTEAIMIALMEPDFYQELMPEQYKNDPMRAFYILDHDQRSIVKIAHHTKDDNMRSEKDSIEFHQAAANDFMRAKQVVIDESMEQGDFVDSILPRIKQFLDEAGYPYTEDDAVQVALKIWRYKKS